MICNMLTGGSFVNNGSSVRKMLNYKSGTPRIDILIRESIQNSLDALLDSSGLLRFRINYDKFSTVQLADKLDGLGESLKERFGERSDFLELRDVGTAGLNGPVDSVKREEYGNFIKIVFQIAERQEQEGKGGSWGYGKTNYFTFGSGIVIYYSRTEYEGRK